MNFDATLVETRKLKLNLSAEWFRLEHGGVLPEIEVAYETFGTLNEFRDNVIFVCHALTGDAHVAGRYVGDVKPTGWWSNMVFPGGGIDTNRFFVVCANILGGCKGTTGPSSINPETGKQYGSKFPNITVRDIVTVHKMLLEQLGFNKIHAILGGSFGGMQAIEFCAQFPDFAEKCICIAAGPSLTTQALAFDIIGREAIVKDPNWRNGDYYEDGLPPSVGLAQARKLAHVTYLSNEMMHQKFGRRRSDLPKEDIEALSRNFKLHFEVTSYLDYQGEKFINRFDANSYLHITRAMDEYDLTIGFKNLKESVERIQSKNLIVALSGDWLFLPSQSDAIVKAMLSAKKDVSYFCIDAPAGHDAFLTHVEHLGEIIAGFLTGKPEHPPEEITQEQRYDYKMLSDMVPEKIESLLDLACGNGKLIEHVKEIHPNVNFTGVDIDLSSLVEVVKAGNNAFLADVDSGLGIIPDNSFDCAILSESLQVMKHPDKVLEELLRIAPVGLVSFPNFGMWRVRLWLLFRGRMPKTRRLPYDWYDTPNIHLCTVNDFVSLCKKKGIKIESVKYLSTFKISKIFCFLGLKNLGASRALVKIRR